MNYFFSDKFLDSTFCLLLVAEVFSVKKVVKMLKVAVSWWEVRWIWQMRQNFPAQFVQFLKCWVYHVWSGVLVEKNWALYVDQCQLQALQFSVYLIDFLSMLLRCNGFAGIQKAVMERWGEDHQTVTTIFFGYRSGFGKRFRASSQSSHWASHHWLLYKTHLSLCIRNHKKWFDVAAENKRRPSKQWLLWSAVSSRGACSSGFSTFLFVPNTKRQ